MLGDLFQPMHLLLILIIVLLLFGPGKLPQIAANMGKSIREFKSALSAPDEINVPEKSASKPAQPVQQAKAAQTVTKPASESAQAASEQGKNA